jgi:hypothetical protein
MRTHIIKKNSHPVYDELFEFSNINHNLSLLFTILTYDTFTRDEILGQVLFPIISPDGTVLNTLDSTETSFTQDITPRQKQVKKKENINKEKKTGTVGVNLIVCFHLVV